MSRYLQRPEIKNPGDMHYRTLTVLDPSLDKGGGGGGYRRDRGWLQQISYFLITFFCSWNNLQTFEPIYILYISTLKLAIVTINCMAFHVRITIVLVPILLSAKLVIIMNK